ncbi:MAG: isoprenylcysteine carboxylmethyltransferase family protein [Betaproteobacteria bacterium]|nr:isoprenylcysteine carboxylmethyltransferase family protein [Betaproteobacteria bacterium]
MPRVIASPPLIYLVAVALVLALHARHPLPLASGGWTIVLGGGLIGGGGLLVAWAFRTMTGAGTTGRPSGRATALVTNGPVRFSRNPIYLAMTGMYLGVGLAANTWWTVGVLPLMLLVVRFGVIDREERRLERQFGAAYHTYAARVRRWF